MVALALITGTVWQLSVATRARPPTATGTPQSRAFTSPPGRLTAASPAARQYQPRTFLPLSVTPRCAAAAVPEIIPPRLGAAIHSDSRLNI